MSIMFDKVDLEITFHPMYVNLSSQSTAEDISGFVDPELYDFRLVQIYSNFDGERVAEPIKAQAWDSISSGMGGVAVGFYPEGNGFNKWPHVRIKCSPAKILQAHNVFGSENPKEGITQMLATFAQVYPQIYSHLDLDNIRVRYLDCTYSAKVTQFYRTHVYRTFRALARSNQQITKLDEYLKIGGASERCSLKIYYKLQELLADLQGAKRKRDAHRVSVLSDQRLQDWALDLMRFEATIGHRKLEEMGVPTKLNEFLKYLDWFEETHKQTACNYLWGKVFNPVFRQLEGSVMKNVNDNEIKAMVDKAHITISDSGKISKRRSNAVFKCYKSIKNEGYDVLSKEDNQTFYRNVNFLVEAGLSRAFLKTLGPDSPENVIPIIQVINIDFKNQRPEWWVEPKAGFNNPATLPKSLVPRMRLVS